MILTKGKHIVEEINGIRCSIVEKEVLPERMAFIKNLLTINGFEVKVSQTGETCTIGVTDIVFNIVIAIYNQSLKTPENLPVSPAYWRQYTSEPAQDYWNFKK